MAQLDPSIILGIRPVEVKPYDASSGLIKGMTLKNLMQQNQTGELQQKSLQQAYDDDMTLRSVYQGAGGDPEAVRRGLAEKGLYKQLNEFDKNQLAIKKDQTSINKDLAAISKDNLEMDVKKLNIINNVGMGPLLAYKSAIAKGVPPEMAMQAVQPMWEAAVNQLRNNPVFDEKFLSQVPTQFDPNDVEAQLAQSLKYTDVLNNELQRRGQDITARGQDMSQQTAIRGQNMSAETTRRGQDLSQETTRRGQDLTNERAKEKNKSEKVTDTQRTNSGYAARMKAADGIFSNTKTQKPGVIETVAKGFPAVGNEISANLARSFDGDRQQALQAQEDWVRAKLRKESGAVIADEEMAREIRTYFPQIGDSDAVVRQKAQARKQALAGMETSAGAAYTPVLDDNSGWGVEEVNE